MTEQRCLALNLGLTLFERHACARDVFVRETVCKHIKRCWQYECIIRVWCVRARARVCVHVTVYVCVCVQNSSACLFVDRRTTQHIRKCMQSAVPVTASCRSHTYGAQHIQHIFLLCRRLSAALLRTHTHTHEHGVVLVGGPSCNAIRPTRTAAVEPLARSHVYRLFLYRQFGLYWSAYRCACAHSCVYPHVTVWCVSVCVYECMLFSLRAGYVWWRTRLKETMCVHNGYTCTDGRQTGCELLRRFHIGLAQKSIWLVAIASSRRVWVRFLRPQQKKKDERQRRKRKTTILFVKR